MTRPTVVFDGAVLGEGPGASPGVARSFLTTLEAYVPRTAAHCVLLVPPRAERRCDLPAGVRLVRGPAGRWHRQHGLPRLLRALGADLLHVPVAAPVVRAPCPQIATVHDLPWLALEPLAETGCSAWHRLAVRLAARQAAAIVTPTAATAADLHRFLGRPPRALVRVIHHGVPPASACPPVEPRFGPLLVIGDQRPRKNLGRVRCSHERARERAADLPPLRCVGPGSDFLSRTELARALGEARALVHLAVHEGFGLPVAEAFAHGTPVLCSAVPSLSEVAAGAALLADPRDEQAMARAMIRIHRDADLRQRLHAAGLARAAALTPAASAAGWLELHQELLQRRLSSAAAG
jgi:glycosyltransferase involved in cell wall biosynthesis